MILHVKLGYRFPLVSFDFLKQADRVDRPVEYHPGSEKGHLPLKIRVPR
jgi:hypothetical protein